LTIFKTPGKPQEKKFTKSDFFSSINNKNPPNGAEELGSNPISDTISGLRNRLITKNQNTQSSFLVQVSNN